MVTKSIQYAEMIYLIYYFYQDHLKFTQCLKTIIEIQSLSSKFENLTNKTTPTLFPNNELVKTCFFNSTSETLEAMLMTYKHDQAYFWF
jgi:hypothetical protein